MERKTTSRGPLRLSSFTVRLMRSLAEDKQHGHQEELECFTAKAFHKKDSP
jgi:hypothetical protein